MGPTSKYYMVRPSRLAPLLIVPMILADGYPEKKFSFAAVRQLDSARRTRITTRVADKLKTYEQLDNLPIDHCFDSHKR